MSTPPRTLPWKPILGAACVLVVGLAIAVYVLRDDDASPRAGDERAALEARVRTLQETHPALFSDFALLSDAELAAREVRPRLRLHEPRGALLDPRPTFRWQVPDGAGSADLTVTDAEGTLVFAATTDKGGAVWPSTGAPLAAGGRYVWRVEMRFPDGTQAASMGFRVLDEAATQRYGAGFDAIRSTEADARIAALLATHWAIRADLLRAAHVLCAAAGKRRVAHETRAWLDARLGR